MSFGNKVPSIAIFSCFGVARTKKDLKWAKAFVVGQLEVKVTVEPEPLVCSVIWIRSYVCDHLN